LNLNLNTEKDGTVGVEGVDEVIGRGCAMMGGIHLGEHRDVMNVPQILTGCFSSAYQVKIL
jgi:hypothetical protein